MAYAGRRAWCLFPPTVRSGIVLPSTGLLVRGGATRARRRWRRSPAPRRAWPRGAAPHLTPPDARSSGAGLPSSMTGAGPEVPQERLSLGGSTAEPAKSTALGRDCVGSVLGECGRWRPCLPARGGVSCAELVQGRGCCRWMTGLVQSLAGSSQRGRLEFAPG